jgi:hypothetical protein
MTSTDADTEIPAGPGRPARLRRRLSALPSAIVVLLVLGIGAAGAGVSYVTIGSEDLFNYEQSQALGLATPFIVAANVDETLSHVPAPVVPSKRTPAVSTQCQPHGPDPLRNPWTCVIRYRSGVTAHYLIQINSDGSFTGAGTGDVSGCCVKLPTVD